MSRYVKLLLAVVLGVAVIVGGYAFYDKDRAFKKRVMENIKNDGNFELHGAVIYHKDFADSISSIKDHYQQTLAINTNLEYIESDSVNKEAIKDMDFLHIHDSIKEESLNLEVIEEFVDLGGVLLFGAGLNIESMNKLAGIKGYSEISLNKDSDISTKALDENIEGLSKLGYYFIKHNLDWSKQEVSFNQIETGKAKPLVEIAENPIIVKKDYGKGKILVLSDLFLNYKSYITGYDLIERDEDKKYFSFFQSTFNQKTIDGLLEYISLEKYGLAFFKTQGPYGRPGLAWQNHYELLDSIKNKEVIAWAKLLKKENQVPTISLVRGSYNWGEWYGSISYHENKGDNSQPVFIGEELDSFYSFGRKLQNLDGTYLTFGKLDTYRSYYEKFQTTHRTYPQMVDWNNDEEYDLVVGTDSGEILLYINENGKFRPAKSIFSQKNLGTQLAIAFEKNQKELLVGNNEGKIYKLSGFKKSKNEFTEVSLLKDASGNAINADAMAAPAVGDLDNNGRADLVVGHSSGRLDIYLSTKEGFKHKKTIEESIGQNLSPSIGDYNSDGKKDILVGNHDGKVHIFLNSGDLNFSYQGAVETQRKNIYGENTIYTGKNVVPLLVDFNKDGAMDLLTGELSFSTTYDISSDQFQYKEELKEIIAYLQDNYIPILPHLYSHSYKDDTLEKEEYARHREVFHKLGIPWEHVGTDQHTWRVNFEQTRQTFNNQIDEDIYYNFAFRTPNNPGDPGFVLNYLWPNLWIYDNGKNGQMAMSTPSPTITMFPGIHRELALLDLPIIFFEHIENQVYNRELAPKLRNMINEINYVRDHHNYVFLTEDQMAQSFINNIKTNYKISLHPDKIQITRDTSGVPEELTGLYRGTNGVKVVVSKKMPEFYSKELIQYKSDNQLYIGFLSDSIELSRSQNDAQPFTIISSNSPLIVNGNTIKLNHFGMKQMVVVSDKPLHIDGEGLDIVKKNNKYEITHWGEPVDITISEEDQ